MQPNVSAILLAAGQSRRMGRCKQLLPIPDRPVVVRCVETILAAGIAEVILVAGAYAEEITLAVEGFPVTIVCNEDQGSDMAGSVRVGLSRLSIDAERVFVCLCDHPLVSPTTLSAMCMHDPGWSDALVIPCHKGRKGHPTLFPRFMLEEVENPCYVAGRHQKTLRKSESIGNG